MYKEHFISCVSNIQFKKHSLSIWNFPCVPPWSITFSPSPPLSLKVCCSVTQLCLTLCPSLSSVMSFTVFWSLKVITLRVYHCAKKLRNVWWCVWIIRQYVWYVFKFYILDMMLYIVFSNFISLANFWLIHSILFYGYTIILYSFSHWQATMFFPVLFLVFNYKHSSCKSYSTYLLVYLRESLLRVCIDGVQGKPSQNVPLWHVAYFVLTSTKPQWAQENLFTSPL